MITRFYLEDKELPLKFETLLCPCFCIDEKVFLNDKKYIVKKTSRDPKSGFEVYLEESNEKDN